VQPLQPKQMVPDYGKSQHENYSHSKTRLPDYHDSAANVANSAFYSKCVTTNDLQSLPNKNTQSFCDPIHKDNITCCVLSIVKTEK